MIGMLNDANFTLGIGTRNIQRSVLQIVNIIGIDSKIAIIALFG